MSTTAEKDKIFWNSLSAYGDTIFIAGTTGMIVQFSLIEGITHRYDTELDSPHLKQTSTTVLAIGRWDTEWITIEKKTKKIERHNALFNGRTTAVATFESQFFIAGANKDENAGASIKDQVKLKKGLLYSINDSFEKELLKLSNKGRIQNLALSKKWLAFVDDAQKNTIVLKDRINNTEIKIDEKSVITATLATSENIYYAISTGVKKYSEDGIQQIPFKEKNLSILKIVKVSESIYTLTSEGIFELATGKKISEQNGQPSSISPYKNGILTLWQDGILEFYETGHNVKKYSIT